MRHAPVVAWLLLISALSGFIWLIGDASLLAKAWIFSGLFEDHVSNDGRNISSFDHLWYKPNDSRVANVSNAVNGKGVYDFVFSDSTGPAENDYYGGYNYCNMPHVNRKSYVQVSKEYTLEYTEVVSRMCDLCLQMLMVCKDPPPS